jgi:hypothetical protein
MRAARQPGGPGSYDLVSWHVVCCRLGQKLQWSPGDLDSALTEVWGAVRKAGKGKGMVQGPPRLIGVRHVLWVAIQASVKRVGYLCNVHTWTGCSRDPYGVQPSLGKN